jgi:PilZ domain
MRCTDEAPALPFQPSPSVVAFVRRQVSQAELYKGQDRRAELRHLLVRPVLVYPADEKFSPVGPSRAMVIRDVSPRGLGLVHEEPLNLGLILVRISLPEIEALVGAEVRFSRAVGPFYYFGCEIDAQFDSILPLDVTSS